MNENTSAALPVVGAVTGERPILFSAPMVRAILAGTKTQTRRAVKGEIGERDSIPTLNGQPLVDCPAVLGQCPYGAPGDRLWVREKLYLHEHAGARGGWLYAADNAQVELPADHPRVPDMIAWAHHQERDYCVSIHMPRWASRITLEITGVRVQQLCDISEEDAKAEGAAAVGLRMVNGGHSSQGVSHWNGYVDIWESINGPGSWDVNPWVWVVEFRRLQSHGPDGVTADSLTSEAAKPLASSQPNEHEKGEQGTPS